MSVTRTQTILRETDHFLPDDSSDPHAQRRLRGHLEQVDYIAYASNREVIGQALGSTDAKKFQRMAVAAAEARARWVGAALSATESARTLSPAQVHHLAQLREAYHELAEVYDAMRRMVERGYVTYEGA